MRNEKLSPEKPELMRISDLCQETGFSKPVIMHYLKLRLLPEPLKISSNLHLYNKAHVDALAKVGAFRDEGLSLAEIKEALDSGREPKQRQPSAPGLAANGDKGQRIVEMAIQLFSKNGYENVKVSDITDALNIGKGTFYLYFGNKHELLHACFSQIQSLLFAAEKTEEIREAPDLATKMKNRWLYFQTNYPHFAGFLQLLQTTANASEPQVKAMALKAYDRIIAPIRADLKKAQKKGELPALDPELVAYSVIGILNAASFIVIHDNTYTIEAAAQTMGEMLKRLLNRPHG